MTHRKISLGAVLILFAAQAVAMKRSGGDLVKSKSAKIQKQKTTKDSMEKLNKTIRLCDADKFAQLIHHEPNLVNAKINDEPVVFELLQETDKLRNANVQYTNQRHLLEGFKSSNIMAERINAAIKKNDDKMVQLHRCLEMVVNHDNFDAQSTNSGGSSVVMSLLGRPCRLPYSSAMERVLPSQSTQSILYGLLKKDNAAVDRTDGDGFGFLHYATRMPLYGEEYIDAIDSVDGIIDINKIADFCIKSEENALEIVETIVHSGANINSVSKAENNTALHFAATDLTKTSLLIALGADPHIKNYEGQIPADVSKNSRVIEILNNPEKHIEDINKLVLKNGARETTQKSFFKLVTQRQMKQSKINLIKNQCPYTQAVLEKHQDISAEEMAMQVAYEIMGDELVSDEDSEMIF